MNVTALAIRSNRVTYAVLAILLLSGISALNTLPRAEDPGFTVRTAVVTTRFPGASAERVEELVTDPIEKKVREIPELDFVSSDSRTGVSIVNVNVHESYTEMRPIWDTLRRKMQAVADDLPTGIIGPTVDDEFGDVFPIMLTIVADGFTYSESKGVADEVRDRLLELDQVAKVELYGVQDERVFIEYTNSRLAEVGISPTQFRQVLESRNILISGGTITAFGEDIALEPSGNYESLEDLGRTIIEVPGRSDVVYLGDLAQVRRGYVDPPTAIMHSSGARCLGLAIAPPQGSGNVSVLGSQVRALVEQLRYDYPVGVDFDLVLFQPDFIDKQVDDFVVNLGQAIGIVLLVMLVSLGFRTGLVVSALIPSAMLITLFLMHVLGIGLNQISIAALIIALGMLVDNAIVMSESIMVQMSEGKKAYAAAIDSAQELRVPLLTSSLTTAAAFLPIYLAESAVGEYTRALFQVVTLTLLTSWALSLTMMPLLCMSFLRAARAAKGGYDSRFYIMYRGLLVRLLKHPLLTLAGIGIVFLLSMKAFALVPQVFMPKSDSPRLLADFDFPLGTSIGVTEEAAFQLERYVLDEFMVTKDREEGFLKWSTHVGAEGGVRYRLPYSPATDGSEHWAMVFTATSRGFIDAAIPRLRAYVDDHLPGVVQDWRPETQGAGGSTPIQVRISGPGRRVLFDLVDGVKGHLRTVPGTYNIEDDWGPRTKKLRVNINQARARRAGVTSEDVAVSLQSSLSGIVTTEFREGNKSIPVTLRLVAAERTDLGKFESANVYAQATGQSVPLRQIADIEVVWEPSKVLRRDGKKTVTVGCQLESGADALGLSGEFLAWMEESSRDWPRGYTWRLGGDFEDSEKANASLAAKLPIAGFVIVLLLISQFNSFRRAGIILLTIPLGLIGVSIGLLVTREDFTFFAMLGVISLAGIIINNAIVLIDRINIEIVENGRAPADAIIESAQRRLRPILVTTATTMGGLLPLWMFGGPMWAPMAVSILFGLLFATILTLGIVPVLYRLFFRVSFRGYVYDNAGR